jgi:molecular chaperone HtpG
MAKGKISVHTDNLLPIIKKWLYSDSDIFIRELVSNAQDAIMKLKKLNAMGEADIDDKFEIKVELDKENSLITITDNGIGMTEDEVEKYINQVAFSGAEEFIKKYENEKDEKSQIIGHFGLGFYSAFMASSQVEIDTLSYKDGAKAVHWVSDGGTEYEISDSDKMERGTTITLHISDDFKDYLEVYKLRETLNKYCSFLPVEIYLIDKANTEEKELSPVNDTNPLWLKNPNECTEEEYKAFYHKVFFDMNDPLFWIHLNVDFPFNLKGILYFPKLNHEFQTIEGQIKLYNNQVFIADNIKEVIPEYLMLLKGVIDCPDLPLNVSRSFLQNDGYVAKVSNHITKKVADKLNGIYKTDKENFEKYWDDINPFIKYGCMRDEKFYDKVKDVILFKKLDDTYVSLKELTESDKKEVFYVTDVESQNQYIELLKQDDIEPVLLNNMIDNHFSSFLEYKINDIKFKRVDSFITDSLKESNEENKENDEKLKELFAPFAEGTQISVERLKSDKISAMYVLGEEARRMEEMQKMYGGMNIPGMPKPEETLVINASNPLVVKAMDISDKKLQDMICANIVDMAKLSHNTLNGDDRTKYLDRCVEMMNILIK